MAAACSSIKLTTFKIQGIDMTEAGTSSTLTIDIIYIVTTRLNNLRSSQESVQLYNNVESHAGSRILPCYKASKGMLRLNCPVHLHATDTVLYRVNCKQI
jgi:hypothetical protein